MPTVFFVSTPVACDAGVCVVVEACTASRTVQQAIASHGRSATYVSAIPASESVLALAVADELAAARVSWAGVRPRFLRYGRAQVYMALHYEGLPVPPHRLFDGSIPGPARLAAGLGFPVALRDATAVCTEELVAKDEAEYHTLFDDCSAQRTRFVAESYKAGELLHVRAFGAGDRAKIEIVADRNIPEAFIAKVRKAFAAVYESNGSVTFSFRAVGDSSGDDAFVLVDAVPFVALDEMSSARLIATANGAPPPTFAVAFHPEFRGYHVSAARDLPKGTIVFHDEGHAFPIVTKGHVEKHWSAEDQDTFKRYAWPLDSDAHVYAVWENDPRTWRPINHSCDPNLVFAESHSLNVVAARDIAVGDDLTLDYTTFCDQSMEAFDCFCGASACRKRIFPDEANLQRFGGNAWHRRLPTATH
jgi:hypothetical protein